jgi:ABC-2 type transport system permease protein
MTATTPHVRGIPSIAEPGFRTTLRSEWTKIRSIRSTWIIVGLAIVLSIGTSALVSLVIGMTISDWGESGFGGDPVLSSMTGLLPRLILLVTLGVIAVTSEYSSGMIRTTFMVNPRRTQVLAAKAIILAAIALVVGAITVPGMFLVSQPIFAAHGLPTASILDGDNVRFLVVFALGQALVYTLFPFLIACILRGTASSITVAFGFLLLPYNLSPVVPDWVKANVFRYLPDLAVDSLAGMTTADSITYLSPTPAIIVIVVWFVGLFAVAAATLERRDV